MIPNDDGRDRRTLRSQKWSTARCDVTTQERRIRDERRTLFSSRKWKEAEAHFLISLPLILARIKHGREKWISRLWRRLRIQWNTSNTTRMAQAMMVVMTRPNTSILYSLVSFENSTVYDGLVQDRPGTARMTEHSAATSDTNRGIEIQRDEGSRRGSSMVFYTCRRWCSSAQTTAGNPGKCGDWLATE